MMKFPKQYDLKSTRVQYEIVYKQYTMLKVMLLKHYKIQSFVSYNSSKSMRSGPFNVPPGAHVCQIIKTIETGQIYFRSNM